MQHAAESGDSQCTAMASSALERLFKANLPAKYWVTGSLDMTDSTVGIEFYDAGPVSHYIQAQSHSLASEFNYTREGEGVSETFHGDKFRKSYVARPFVALQLNRSPDLAGHFCIYQPVAKSIH